jgi:hypothetical protein
MTTVLIGSCVTRDVYTIEKLQQPSDFHFFARMSFATMFTDAFSIPVEATSSPWQNKMLAIETNKSLPYVLQKLRPDIIVLDLIDERFDIYEYGSSRLNVGAEFISAGIKNIAPNRIIPRLSNEALSLWKDGVDNFANLIATFSPRIFIHCARWATQYRDGSHVRDFPEAPLILPDLTAKLGDHNDRLLEYESYLSRRFKDATLIKVSDEHIVGDRDHIWGLAPFHYITPYYRGFLASAEATGLDFVRGKIIT